MSQAKPVLGLIEDVKLILPTGKTIKLEGKIDTGAHFTALDLSLAKKLNLQKSLNLFNKFCPKFKITNQNFQTVRKQLKNKYTPLLKNKIPSLIDIRLIPATNGFSVRPYFKVEFILKNKKIKTKASLVDRAHMKYPVLIGKKDMKGFLIDPTKNTYNTI